VTERTRILHFVTSLDRGGAENALLSLLPRLDPRRYECHVAFLKGPGGLAPEFEAAGIPVHRLRMGASWDASVLVRGDALARRLRPDVVHGHLFRAEVVAGSASRRIGVPLVITKHDRSPVVGGNPFARFLARRLARRAARIVLVSDSVARWTREVLGPPADSTRLIRYGFDPSDADARPAAPDMRDAAGWPPDAPLILFAGRLAPLKGADVLLTAFARVLQALPSARLALAGGGPMRRRLLKRARVLGLGDRVAFLGERDDVAALMRQADALALPSRWEGLGHVLLEAMAMRLPAVGTYAGALPEVIEHGVTGLVVAADDADAFAAALIRTLGAPDRRAEMGEAARRRVVERYAIDAEIDDTEALYDDLVPEPGLVRRPVPPPPPLDPPFRVCVVTRRGRGGVARHVRTLTREIGRDLYDLSVAASPLEESAFLDRLGAEGVPVTRFPLRREVSPWSDLVAVGRLVRHLLRERPDLVHAHAGKAGAVSRIAGTIAGVPVLITPHGWPFGTRIDDPRGEVLRVAERLLRPFGAGVVCVSESDRRVTERHALMRRARTYFVPNAIDTNAYASLPDREQAREELGLPPGARVALMMGQLEPPKDPLTFVRAAAFVRFGPTPVRFLLVGDGPLRDACLDAAIDYGVEDLLVAPGAIPNTPALLAAADVLVLATRFEGLPYSLLEGQAAGLPLVASNVPGCHELLKDGRGTLVPAGDAPALARAIETIFDADAPPAPQPLPDRFGVDAWIERIEEIYHGIIVSEPRRRRRRK